MTGAAVVILSSQLDEPRGDGLEMAKRIFDLLAASVGLAIISPALLFIAIAVKLGSKGPVFYRGVRTGLYGRPFRIFKFR